MTEYTRRSLSDSTTDAGSTPAASTSLRQGFGWQAEGMAKAVRRSFSEGGQCITFT